MLPDEETIIIVLYYALYETLGARDIRHPKGELWLSETLLIGVLWA